MENRGESPGSGTGRLLRRRSRRWSLGHSFGFARPLRSSEVDEFRHWLRVQNARRTRLVAYVMMLFAVVGAALSLLGDAPGWALVYGGYLAALAVAAAVITIGLTGNRTGVALAGEVVALGTAFSWMFIAVANRVEVGYGLAEFLIGALGLALLRFMRPAIAAIAFPVLAVGYGLVLARAGAFEATAFINAFVFSSFALIWSITAYRGRVTAFRNTQLLGQLNRQNAQLSLLALQDSLTGLPNRRYFEQALERRWEDEAQRQDPVGLVLVDIDHFKEYNDTRGHPAGDACLQMVARLLTDTVGSGGFCVRFGGEEFAVVLSSGQYDGRKLAEQIVERIRQDADVTVSAGVAGLAPTNGSPGDLYAMADRALYRAKQLGRDRVELADGRAGRPGAPPVSGQPRFGRRE